VPFGIIWSPRKALYGLNKVGAEESDNGAGKLSGTEYCKWQGIAVGGTSIGGQTERFFMLEGAVWGA